MALRLQRSIGYRFNVKGYRFNAVPPAYPQAVCLGPTTIAGFCVPLFSKNLVALTILAAKAAQAIDIYWFFIFCGRGSRQP